MTLSIPTDTKTKDTKVFQIITCISHHYLYFNVDKRRICVGSSLVPFKHNRLIYIFLYTQVDLKMIINK